MGKNASLPGKKIAACSSKEDGHSSRKRIKRLISLQLALAGTSLTFGVVAAIYPPPRAEQSGIESLNRLTERLAAARSLLQRHDQDPAKRGFVPEKIGQWYNWNNWNNNWNDWNNNWNNYYWYNY